jgi:hypothetical protein
MTIKTRNATKRTIPPYFATVQRVPLGIAKEDDEEVPAGFEIFNDPKEPKIFA